MIKISASVTNAVTTLEGRPLKHRILSHFPIITMFLVIGLLSIGINANGSPRAMTGIFAFAVVTFLTYFFAMMFESARYPFTVIADFFVLPEHWRDACVWLVGLSAVLIALVHFVAFDGLTLGAALTAKSNVDVALIRQHILEDLPTSMQYLNAIAIKALFPIGLLLAVTRKMKLLSFILAATGLFYAVCMMQKSGPVIFVLPVMAYFLVTGRWFKLILTGVVVVGVVMFMGTVANPQIQSAAVQSVLQNVGTGIVNDETPATDAEALPAPAPTPAPAPQPRTVPEGESATVSLIKALVGRVAITPGDVAAKWFDAIPADVPYGEGCGYRFLTPFLGCSFQNYSRILYDKFYPNDAQLGMRGSVNAASMMTAYANFGFTGIILSGILHGLIAFGLFVAFQRNPVLSPAFNVTYLLLLSSGDLFTIMVSGGWGLSILLYLTLSRSREVGVIASAADHGSRRVNDRSHGDRRTA